MVSHIVTHTPSLFSRPISVLSVLFCLISRECKESAGLPGGSIHIILHRVRENVHR